MKKNLDFYLLFLAAIQEKGLSIQDIEKENILHKNAFYGFKDNCPSLKNAIQIANFIHSSLDYILENSDENNFVKYQYPIQNFDKNLSKILKEMNISKNALSRGVGFTHTNYVYWKRGSQPKLSTLIEIAQFLNCKIDDLLEREN